LTELTAQDRHVRRHRSAPIVRGRTEVLAFSPPRTPPNEPAHGGAGRNECDATGGQSDPGHRERRDPDANAVFLACHASWGWPTGVGRLRLADWVQPVSKLSSPATSLGRDMSASLRTANSKGRLMSGISRRSLLGITGAAAGRGPARVWLQRPQWRSRRTIKLVATSRTPSPCCRSGPPRPPSTRPRTPA